MIVFMFAVGFYAAYAKTTGPTNGSSLWGIDFSTPGCSLVRPGINATRCILGLPCGQAVTALSAAFIY